MRRKDPPELPASSTALSMAGLAASTSPRSTGTRMVLNMALPPGSALPGRSVNDETVELRSHPDLTREPRVGAHVEGEVEHVLLHGLGLARGGFPLLGDIDMACGAGAGSAALGLNAGNAIADGSFHDGCALLRFDGAGGAFGIDERDLDHCGPLL